MALVLAAAEPARGADSLRLQEVTVQASRVDELLPARTTVERDEIEDSHKIDLGQVLELTPGLNVRDGGRGEPRLDVRGFDQRAVLFTLNGVPVFEPWNGVVNLNLFPVGMLQSVEIDRGPSSSLFGPNGIGGTVKLTTMRPSAPVSATAATQWRDSDTWDAQFSGGVAKDRVVALVGGRYFTTPGFPLPDDFGEIDRNRRRNENGGLRLNSDRDEKDIFTNLSYDYADDGRAHVTVLGSNAQFGVPPSTTAFAGPFFRNPSEELVHAQAGLEQRLTPTVGVAGTVFYTGYDTQERDFTGADFRTTVVTKDFRSEEFGGLGRLTFDLGDADSLAVAGQVRRASIDASDDFDGDLVQARFITSSLGAENVYQLNDRVALVAGMSLDIQTGSERPTQWELDPQAGVSVDSGAYGTSRAAISRKIRFPTLRELYDPQQGNPDLKAEKALVYEIGHRVQRPRGYADLNLFRSDVNGLIENQGDQGQAVNAEDATLQGLEIALGGRPLDWLQLDVNYTYLDTHVSVASKLGSITSDVQHRPPHRFNGILRLFLPLAFVMRLEGLYTSSQLNQASTTVTVDGYTLFNAQLSRQFGRYLELHAGVDNALDAEHQDRLGSPGPGRWVFVGARLTYD